MSKLKRNERLVILSQYLRNRPNQKIKLDPLGQRFNIAKSSLSEDIAILKGIFHEHQLGQIVTIKGASGGVIYYPYLPTHEIEEFQETVLERLSDSSRILAGNYIDLTDIIDHPPFLDISARMITHAYQEMDIDLVVTVETKGIGLATLVAYYLNLPYVTVRRTTSDAVGLTVSVNYASGSHHTIKKMELSKESIKPGSKVLIVDDFLRNGGTIRGLQALLGEFQVDIVGICVLIDNSTDEIQQQLDFASLFHTDIAFDDAAGGFTINARVGRLR